MSGCVHAVDYLSEAQAFALRTSAFAGRKDYELDFRNLKLRFPSGVEVPVELAQRFMRDWQACGAWSLHGREMLGS